MKFEKIIHFKTPSELAIEPSTIAFVGNALDERGKFAKAFLEKKAQKVLNCSWEKTEMFFCIDDKEELRPYEIARYIEPHKPARITIEATTLGFVEILMLVNAIKECPSVKEVDFLYIEPRSYSEIKSTENPLPHNFSLSDSLGKMIPIPGFTRNFARKKLDVHLVSFLGFEPSRLGRILEDDEGSTITRYTCSFGVPAFVPGWENHAMDSNVSYLNDPRREEVTFFAANNPKSAYENICAIAQSLDDNERLVIAPFGTKPAGIGSIVYAVQHSPMCGIIYDHPIRRKDRSNGVGRCHLYRCLCCN